MNFPDRFKEAKARPDAPISLTWWQGFRSTEMSRLIETARANNLDMAAALTRIEQAEAQVSLATAPLLPSINGSVGAQNAMSSRSLGRGGHSNVFSGLLSAGYELDFWGKNRNSLLASEQNAVAARYNYDVVELATIAAVANTYLQLLAAQDALRITEGNVRNATSILSIIQERVNVGTATSLDLAQQEVVVANQKALIPPRIININQYRAALAVLTGEFPGNVTIRGGTLNGLNAPRPAPGLPSQLLLRRPDIRQSAAVLAAQNATVASAKAALLPSFSLTGQTGYESPVLKTLFNPQSALYSVAANATQPIFDGGRLLAQLELQHSIRSEDVQAYKKAVLTAASDVEQALVSVQETARQRQLQAQAAASAEKAYRIAGEQLRAGTVDITTVLNTQQSYFVAQLAQISVRLSQLQASVSLHQALGGGWTPGEITAARQSIQLQEGSGSP